MLIFAGRYQQRFFLIHLKLLLYPLLPMNGLML